MTTTMTGRRGAAMTRATAAVAVLLSVWLPARAQDEVSTAAGVKAALAGFATDFFVSNCFNRPAPPLRIAVAQMPASSRKFSDDDADTVTGWVEDALQGERLFQIVPRRQRYELDEIVKALGDKNQAASHELDGIVTITPEGGGRSVNVVAYTSTMCKGPSRSIAIGTLTRSPDIPSTFFEHAVKRLPREVTRLVVMPPDLMGLPDDLPARVMGRRLQGLLASAAGEFFQRPDVSGGPRPVIEILSDGMDTAGAWQAFVHVSRAQQDGFDVRVEFRGPAAPGAPQEAIYDRGFLGADILPRPADPEVTAEAERVCARLEQALDGDNAADALSGLAATSQGTCPRLHDALVKKAERICSADRTHWQDAMAVSLEAMEETLRQVTCREVRDGARAHLGDIRASMTSAADLGVLSAGRTVTARRAAPGDDPAILKFQAPADDTVRIAVEDASASLDVELRDSSWRIIARRSGATEIEAPVRPAVYYILVSPSPGKAGSAYVLRAAQGFIDTAGDSRETARDLGRLGIGAFTVREHVGGTDKSDVFRFVTEARSLLKLTVTGVTAEVRVDLLDNVRPVKSSSFGPGQPQPLEQTVEAGQSFYIAVTPAAQAAATPYALGIVLAKIAAPPPAVPPVPPAPAPPAGAHPAAVPPALLHPAKDTAADLEIGAPALAATLPAGGNDYWAKFRVWQGMKVRIVLDDPGNALRLSLEDDRGGLPAPLRDRTVDLPPGSYWIHVNRAGGSGAVPFHLGLQRAAL